MKLPDLLVQDLRVLDAKRKSAERDFTFAANIALMALGLDPTLNHHLNLDTAELIPAEPPTAGAGR